MAECNKGNLLEQQIKNVEANSKNWWAENQNSMEKLEKKLDKIIENVEAIPDKVKKDINENVDLKIENRIKETENKIRTEFEEDVKRLTITQGRILIKLIDRETGNTTYQVLQNVKGNVSAVFWQAIARIFGSNLKSEYDPYGEDELIERIIVMIEAGQL